MIERQLGYGPKMYMLSSSEPLIDRDRISEKFFSRDAHPFVIWISLDLCESVVFESSLNPLRIGVGDGWYEQVHGAHSHVHRRC